ncbi:TPA: NAD(P)/FAD-dependent oxidoreductase [Candidatus Bathyarchaeota archaeon]|nr:NAD(P)/FAD-dependent oxidoreductase [Candidatus Bathyarchaeota archaeon]
MGVLVVGGGPAGLITARETARAGIDVTVVEEHAEVGVPTHCAGLLSVDGLERIGVRPLGFVVNAVRGARFFSPSGLSFKIEARRPKAYVVDRELFDKALAEQAAESGANIVLGKRVKDVIVHEDRADALLADGHRVGSDAIVVAEGVRCALTRALGLRAPKRRLQAAQMEIAGVDADPSYVELHFGRRIAPGFFAWKVPLSDDTLRIGLACSDGRALARLTRFVKRELGGRGKVIGRSASLLIAGGPIGRTYGDRFLVVGDAAGQAKPTTGGGVIFGGVCALHAANAIRRAASLGDWSASVLKDYQRGWMKELGRELRLMLIARKVADRLSDRGIDRLFSVVIEGGLAEGIQEVGDIDFQSPALLSLIRHRSAFGVILTIAQDLVTSSLT